MSSRRNDRAVLSVMADAPLDGLLPSDLIATAVIRGIGPIEARLAMERLIDSGEITVGDDLKMRIETATHVPCILCDGCDVKNHECILMYECSLGPYSFRLCAKCRDSAIEQSPILKIAVQKAVRR